MLGLHTPSTSAMVALRFWLEQPIGLQAAKRRCLVGPFWEIRIRLASSGPGHASPAHMFTDGFGEFAG
ncbi:hypothetical protein QF036_002363 [Arthrobacter globiformis]|nr:hypothetical protein [Arthrobacter globiformis]